MSSSARRGAVVALALAMGACAPSLDWRAVHPAGSGVTLWFPCRPDLRVRRVVLAGWPVRLALHACDAGGHTWALAWADMAEPSRVGPALADLRRTAAINVGGVPAPLQALPVPGATPNDYSGHLRVAGRLPDGRPVHMQLGLFAHGTSVMQASVVGPGAADEAAQMFFSSIRIDP
jgi:hypothetical protein